MPGAAAAPPAHLLLRERTRNDHEATEASEGMRRLMAGELDEAGYLALLDAQRALFQGWEAANAHWIDRAASVVGWRYRSRATLLEEDLARAPSAAFPNASPGRSAPARDSSLPHAPEVSANPCVDPERVRELSRAGALPPRDGEPGGGEAVFWGELYVIEGSALGGRLIVRRLRELFPRHAHRFYAVGEDASPSWRRFQSLLDTRLADDASRRSAVDGAQRMFARFRQTLKDPSRHV